MAYNEKKKTELINKVCDRIANGEALRNIIKEKEMPSYTSFYGWLDNDINKSEQYVRACEARQEGIFEEMLTISDNTEQGITTKDTEKGTEVTTADMIAHRRLKVETRKWMLGKMNPKKYGEKMDVTSGGEQIKQTPITIINNDKGLNLEL